MIHSLSLNSSLTLISLGAAVVSLCVFIKGRRPSFRGSRLPPGPAPLPLVGNFFSIDAMKPWLTYTEWGNKYGDIFAIRVFKQDIIVINSEKIAKELFDRRSRIYSDRPYIATRDPYGWNFHFAWEPYGDHWRFQRRIFHQAFRAEACLAYRPIQLRKVHQLILDIINAPHDRYMHIQRFSAAVIMSIVYDYEVAHDHDHLVELFERGNELALANLTPERAAIVDIFPFLLSLPGWLPGASIGRDAAISKYCATQMVEQPFKHARKREAMGSTASVALALLKSIDQNDPSQLQLLKDTCTSAFQAGAETTAATLQWFTLVMVQHPEVQERAQAEIDAVVGANELPDFDDRPNLPYVEAIMMEIMRLHPVAPLGVAHASTDDDIYEGMFIPKGSAVVSNVWAMNYNEEVYPEPDIFKPERFLVDGKLTNDRPIDSIGFGFGRRVCPGRYIADGSIWIAMVSILCAFKIKKPMDGQGKELAFEPSFSHGVTTSPLPFPCSLVPRLSHADLQKLAAVDI